jgi:hypothetical protein
MLGRHSFLAVSGVTDSGKSHEYAETFERGSAVPSSESHGGTIVTFLRQTGSTVSQGDTEWMLETECARSSASTRWSLFSRQIAAPWGPSDVDLLPIVVRIPGRRAFNVVR